MAMIEFVGALYFGITFVITLLIVLAGGTTGIFELIVFGFLALGTITRAARLQKDILRLRRNPDPQESVAIVEEMGMDYAFYYEERQNMERDSIMPPAPKGFSVFQIFSLIAAVFCTLLGIIFIILAIINILRNDSFEATSFGILSLLYVSLATYYGVKDCISSLNYFKLRSYISPAV